MWGSCVAEVRLARPRGVEWRAPPGLEERTGEAIGRYFGGDRPWEEWIDRLPWRSDAHLARCIAAFPGLRLLHQPFGETLLGFLCSATKQIVQIKQMLELVAERFGRPLAPGLAVNRLPTWEELVEVPEAALRGCLLGFRARHIVAVARVLVSRPGWLEETEALPYAEAKTRLCGLPGVGEKVADCVLLFGAGRLEAFPVDVWILRSLAEHYGLEGWRPAQVAAFGRAHFGAHAGLAQQFLFAWERRHGTRSRASRAGTPATERR
jgi:N-glycosylase/DNA lyase